VGLRRRPGALVCGVVAAGGAAGASACGTGLLGVVTGAGVGAGLGLFGTDTTAGVLGSRRDFSIPSASVALSSGCSLRRSNMLTLLISGAPA